MKITRRIQPLPRHRFTPPVQVRRRMSAAPEISPKLDKYTGRLLRFRDLGDDGVHVARLELEKGFPHEYLQFIRRLVAPQKGTLVRIGAKVEAAVENGQPVYLGQVRLGRVAQRFRPAIAPTFVAIIGAHPDENSPSLLAQEIIRHCESQSGERLTPERKTLLQNEVFREMVRELTFDPLVYRFACRQSMIFDFSDVFGAGTATLPTVATTETPFQKEYLAPLMMRLRRRVQERLIDRLNREVRSQNARRKALDALAPPHPLRRVIENSTPIAHEKINIQGRSFTVTVCGLHETEFDIRTRNRLDLFEELQSHCAEAIARTGDIMIEIKFNEQGHGKVTCHCKNSISPQPLESLKHIENFVRGYLEIYTISDLHFGKGGRTDKFLSTQDRLEAFKRLLIEVIKRRATLVLNGDIFDDLRIYNVADVFVSPDPQYEEIYSLLRRVRRIIYISGNHDRVALGHANDFELETLHYKLIAWHQRLRNHRLLFGRFDLFGRLAWPIVGLAHLHRYFYLKKRAKKTPYELLLRSRLEATFPRMKIAPYYMDAQRGLVFEHGDAASPSQIPKVLIKPFLIISRYILQAKYGIDRFLLHQKMRWLRLKMIKIGRLIPIVRVWEWALNAWLQFDVDGQLESLYHNFRIWVYPGPLLNGKLDFVEERVVNPATRIQVLGEMAQWYTTGKVKEWTFTFGHSHLPQGKDEGGINQVLDRIFTESTGMPNGRMDQIHYVNSGHWSSQTFVSSLFENTWSQDFQLFPIPQNPQESLVGTAVVYSFTNPHDPEIRKYMRRLARRPEDPLKSAP